MLFLALPTVLSCTTPCDTTQQFSTGRKWLVRNDNIYCDIVVRCLIVLYLQPTTHREGAPERAPAASDLEGWTCSQTTLWLKDLLDKHIAQLSVEKVNQMDEL